MVDGKLKKTIEHPRIDAENDDDNEEEESNVNQSNTERRNRACSLTEDSCFWARVEETMISCKLLRNGETIPEVEESQRENLVKFEDYVMDLVRKHAVSTEVFLKQSSFMQWWEDYKEIKAELIRRTKGTKTEGGEKHFQTKEQAAKQEEA
ncbi:hypothetical protein Vadar_016255 [Vaccinium darrowii]|uniref:Uncharacterized protein n=1 Tax=Vaccinium darrowii TaxID=229202 RepID=A0ACB7YMP4_9ERIC|nr:hypothetical protein Vadar_016255 [Vaccinium darrowii]